MLLNIVKGLTSYKDLRTINDVTHAIFKEACYAMGLSYDDREYTEGIQAMWSKSRVTS